MISLHQWAQSQLFKYFHRHTILVSALFISVKQSTESGRHNPRWPCFPRLLSISAFTGCQTRTILEHQVRRLFYKPFFPGSIHCTNQGGNACTFAKVQGSWIPDLEKGFHGQFPSALYAKKLAPGARHFSSFRYCVYGNKPLVKSARSASRGWFCDRYQ